MDGCSRRDYLVRDSHLPDVVVSTTYLNFGTLAIS